MMIGALRVKNEARWIERVLKSIQPLCSEILVFDDHSTDGTSDLCLSLGARVIHSPYKGLDESRDKNFLLAQIVKLNPDWVIAIDGDEELTPESLVHIRAAMLKPTLARVSFDILFLWDREDQIRVDGVYREKHGDYRRSSMFRVKGQPRLYFKSTRHGGNFHCKSVPEGLCGGAEPIQATLLHYGYLHRADRIRKYEWYREHDPGSKPGDGQEDGYRHIVLGDLPEFPATMRVQHGGPLKLRPLDIAFLRKA